MRCRLVLCEGKNDFCFIKELLDSTFYHASDIKRLFEFIRSFGESENITLILECGGKDSLYKSVTDLVSKLRGNPFNAILMLDQGGDDTFSKVTSKINEYINTPCKFHPQKPKVAVMQNATLKLSIKQFISNLIVAEVPSSLESLVAGKLKEKFGLPTSTSNPHDLISSVVNQNLLNNRVQNECDVFKLAASESWFYDESWFSRLSELMIIKSENQ